MGGFSWKYDDVMKTEPLTEAAHFAQTQALQVKEKNGAKVWIGQSPDNLLANLSVLIRN